jgi:hypothetical protein
MEFDMPTLSTRAFAEMLSLTVYQQTRVLLEQKYPQKAPQVFKIPFYRSALSAIRKYYESENDPNVLNQSINDIMSANTIPAKKENNIRVLNCFAKSKQANRKLVLLANKKYSVTIGEVNIRLSFDFTAYDGKSAKYIYYNFRNALLDEEAARLSLEISYYVMKANEIKAEMKDLEYIDLFSDKVYSYTSPRKTTSVKVKQNINIIDALWNTV